MTIFLNESAKTIEINGINFTYKPEKDHIVVYNSDNKEVGRYDNVDDLRQDIKDNPESFTEKFNVKENNMDGLFDLSNILLESTEPAEKPAASVPEVGPKPEGGFKEQPATKPAEQGPSIPNKTEIDAATYNAALSNLQKSFKEAYEVIDMLQKTTVVPQSVDELQRQFTESALDDAFLESMEKGPYFEKVDKDDKEEVQGIVNQLRKKVKTYFKDNNYKFYQPNLWARVLLDPTGLPAAVRQIWSTRLWQVVGIVCIEEGNVKDALDELNKEYKDILGDYKLVYFKSIPNIVDTFRLKFGWKNQMEVFFVLVDKSVPKDLEKACNDFQKSEDEKAEKKEEK